LQTFNKRVGGANPAALARNLPEVGEKPVKTCENWLVVCIHNLTWSHLGMKSVSLSLWHPGGFGDCRKKTAVTNALAPPPIPLESCSTAQTDRQV